MMTSETSAKPEGGRGSSELAKGWRGPGSTQKTPTVSSSCCFIGSFWVAETLDKVDQSSVDKGRFSVGASRKGTLEA